MDENVNQGTRSEIIVESKVEGEGSTYTHVETEINGQKQVFETTEPGRYEIKLEASPEVMPTASPEIFNPSSSASSSSDFTHLKQWNLLQRLRDYIVSVLSRWF